MNNKKYDIIGDIHGHADELVKLLIHLGYTYSNTGYFSVTHKVIFLGDFIDRGEHLKQHKELLNIVMTMVNNGHAFAVMGNHEFNALAYHTLHNGKYLRPHTEHNTRQHQAFLNEFEAEPELKQSVLDFFFDLPLWLEIDGIRVIHACWDDAFIDPVRNMAPSLKLTPDLLVEASTKGTFAFTAIERLLKGVEIQLPEGLTYKDKDGYERDAVRVKWWDRKATTLGEIAMTPGDDIRDLANISLSNQLPIYNEDQPPCFVGHYWMQGEPGPLTSNVACLDYSIAKKGKLVAYRWSGELVLKEENFKYASKTS